MLEIGEWRVRPVLGHGKAFRRGEFSMFSVLCNGEWKENYDFYSFGISFVSEDSLFQYLGFRNKLVSEVLFYHGS